jgi:sulfoquinovosidase
MVVPAAVAVAVVVGLAPPTRAAPVGSVDLEDEVVTVDAGGTIAEVQLSPLRLRFLTADGEEALASVPEHPTTPSVREPVPERFPGGGLDLGPAPTYAPITFVDGTQTLVQYPASFWTADILTGVSGGIEHALTEVTTVTERDGGVDLVVETTDPERTATVRVEPDEAGAVAVRVRFDDPSGIATTGAGFTSTDDESFHGFGGRRNATDQRGEVFYNWLEEFSQLPEEFWPVTALPFLDERYQFPTGDQGAYYVQSLFVSSRPYAFWLERDEVSRWRMAADREDAWFVEAAASELDFVVSSADPREAVTALTSITGRNPLPAAWAHGPGVSRAVEPFADDPGTDYAEEYRDDVLRDLDEIEAADLPIETFAIEGWPLLEAHGSLEQVLDRMRELGIRPIGYLKPFIGGGRQTEREGLLTEAIAEGYVATTPLDTPYLFGSPVDPEGVAALLDVTNPDAIGWYQDRVDDLLDLGFEGFMQDFGEQTFQDMRFADGSTGREMHNRYPVLYHRITADAFAAYRDRNPDREPWFYVRAGYTGRPGSAAYEQTSWGGDNTADWSRASGIGSVVPDLLNRGLGGAYGYATDIGGYIDTFGRPDAELLQRWAELGSLLPVNRLHGSPVNGTHMPWEYGDEAVERYRGTIELNLRARPLIRELWQEAQRTGAPIARPLWWHHPDDARARAQEQQFLLGPDVLVAPVIEEGATDWPVYLPEGCWEHLHTGDTTEGPADVEVAAPLGEMPIFVRCGSDPFGGTPDEEPDPPAPPASAPPASERPSSAPATPPPPARAEAAGAPLPATGATVPFALGALALLAAGRLRRSGHP